MEQKQSVLTPKRWLIILLLILCLILLIQNSQVVSFNILFWKISMSRIIAFPLLILLGGVTGYILGRYSRIGSGPYKGS